MTPTPKLKTTPSEMLSKVKASQLKTTPLTTPKMTAGRPEDRDEVPTDPTIPGAVTTREHSGDSAARKDAMAAETPAPKPAEAASDEELLDPQTRLLLGVEEDDQRLLRRAIGFAAIFHVVLLLITFPDLSRPEKLREAGPQKIYVVQQVRFKPPAAAPKQEIPKKKTKKIPIPDPTPDDPEPIPVEELDLPEVEPSVIDVAAFGIPDAPPSTGTGTADGPIYLGAGITPPVKLVFPQPRYTEEARQARIQGTVILQAVIDREGNVGEVLIIKGLPLGLDDSAIETVQNWKFKPALRGAEPVAVYLNLMINFSLQ